MHRTPVVAIMLVLSAVPGALASATVARPSVIGSSTATPAESPEALVYRQALVDLLRGSRRIVIVEHSDPLDAISVDGKTPPHAPSRVYATRELRPEEQAAFAARVGEVPAVLPRIHAMCAFIAHHTIFFHTPSGKPVEVAVCFQCGDIEWVGQAGQAPDGLIGALANTVRAVGLSPQRDWKALMAAPAGN